MNAIGAFKTERKDRLNVSSSLKRFSDNNDIHNNNKNANFVTKDTNESIKKTELNVDSKNETPIIVSSTLSLPSFPSDSLSIDNTLSNSKSINLSISAQTSCKLPLRSPPPVPDESSKRLIDLHFLRNSKSTNDLTNMLKTTSRDIDDDNDTIDNNDEEIGCNCGYKHTLKHSTYCRMLKEKKKNRKKITDDSDKRFEKNFSEEKSIQKQSTKLSKTLPTDSSNSNLNKIDNTLNELNSPIILEKSTSEKKTLIDNSNSSNDNNNNITIIKSPSGSKKIKVDKKKSSKKQLTHSTSELSSTSFSSKKQFSTHHERNSSTGNLTTLQQTVTTITSTTISTEKNQKPEITNPSTNIQPTSSSIIDTLVAANREQEVTLVSSVSQKQITTKQKEKRPQITNTKAFMQLPARSPPTVFSNTNGTRSPDFGKQRCAAAPHKFTNVSFVYCDATA